MIKKISFFIVPWVIAVMINNCVFLEEDESLEYNEFYKESFMGYYPFIEVDANGLPHLLIGASMLYKRSDDNSSNPDIRQKNVTTYHYVLEGSTVYKHNFKNMNEMGWGYFLFGPSRNTDGIYSVIPDLDKMLVYAWETGQWVKKQSVLLDIGWPYEISFDFCSIHHDSLYLPIWFNTVEDHINYRKFAGLQINNKRFMFPPDILTSQNDIYAFPFSSAYVNNTFILPVLYRWFEQDNEGNILLLYRLGNDSITYDTVATNNNGYYPYVRIAQMDGKFRLYFFKGDSLSIYSLQDSSVDIISTKENRYLHSDNNLRGFHIDNAGCFHYLATSPIREHSQNDSSTDDQNPDEDTTTFEPALYYGLECEELQTDTIVLPDSLSDFRFSQYQLSLTLSPDNIVNIAGVLVNGTVDQDLPVFNSSGEIIPSSRLYLIVKETGHWTFHFLDEK